MRMPVDFFLKNYDPGNKELFLKARFIILLTLAVILATLITITYSAWLEGLSSTVWIQVLAAVVMMGALGVLAKGYYNFAIHMIFTAGFSSLWLVMFLTPSSHVLAKVDTIALVIGLFSAMNIAFFQTRKPIAVYFGTNALGFVLFNIYLVVESVLSAEAVLEYFFDNALAITFVFFTAFNAFTINRKILTALRGELAQRKSAQKALAESERKLSEHLKKTPVGAIFWDLNYRVIEWNPAAEGIFGYARPEAMGRQADLILPVDMKVPVDRIFKALFSGRGGERSVNENITKTGKRILCDWYNSTLRDADGKIIGAASLVNDITEKVKIQEMMIQSEKMMSVGGLAAGMAHEIKNPLTGVIQNAQLARRRLAGGGQANQKTARAAGIPLDAIQAYARERGVLKQLDQIIEAGYRAVKVIENMLNFSRRSNHARAAVSLPDLMDSTVELVGHDHGLKKHYNFKDIKIVREYSPSLPAVFCEKTKIQQVLLNLFNNASDSMNMKDYTDNGPRLTLRLKKGEGEILIEVEDNGNGMAPETCRQVFEPFFTTKKDKGTGLGLSISHHIIVEDHSGTMTVTSEPGRGTCFAIKLPLRSESKK